MRGKQQPLASGVQRLLLSGFCAVSLLAGVGCERAEVPKSTDKGTLWSMAHAGHVPVDQPQGESPHRYAVVIHKPEGPPLVELDAPDPQGRTGRVACSTCHDAREPNFSNRSPADLEEFHRQMPFDHGNLACFACHNPGDYNTLRLADESPLEYSEVMMLCAQCHGPQYRAYQHGAHGGMTGYWDLDRGPRERNNCIDCHHPHSPSFPKMVPTFKPRDRFLDRPDAHAEVPHD